MAEKPFIGLTTKPGRAEDPPLTTQLNSWLQPQRSLPLYLKRFTSIDSKTFFTYFTTVCLAHKNRNRYTTNHNFRQQRLQM